MRSSPSSSSGSVCVCSSATIWMACSTRRRNQYCLVSASRASAVIQPCAASCAEHRHGLAAAQLRKAAAGDQLLGLDEELDLADAAAAELDVVALDRDLAMALVRMDLALDRMDVGDRRVVHVFAPDIGLQLLEERLARRDVAGHRPRLDHRGALPVLAAALVVVQRGLDRDRQRRRAGIGPQPQIGAEDIAVLGAVLQDAHEPARQPRKQVGRVHRIDDRRRFRIEEDDQVDVGGEIELVRAELAHAEHDPAGAFAGIFRVRQLQLALLMRVAQQEIDGRAGAGVGKIAQPAHRRLRIRLAGEVGQARSGNALRASGCAAPSSGRFRRPVGARARGDLGEDDGKPLLDRLVEQRVEHLRDGGGRNRAGRSRDRRRRRGSPATSPLPDSNAASRGRSSSAAAAAISESSRRACVRVERQQLRGRPQQPIRAVVFAAALGRHLSAFRFRERP